MKLKSLRSKRVEKSDEVSVGYRPKPSLNKATFLLVFGVLLAAASFYEGTAFQQNADANGNSPVATNSTTTNRASTSDGSQTGSFVRAHIIGQVQAVSTNSITIQNQQTGQNTTLGINSNTEIAINGQTASVSDIQSGDLVIAFKTSNSSNTASRIIVAPGSWSGSSTAGSGSSNTTDPMEGLQSN
jgi:hypothetical protein